jgi:hypothetical protein
MMPDEKAFRADVASDAFQIGILERHWKIVDSAAITWPHVLIRVLSNLTTVTGGSVVLRFTLDGYPETAPGAVPWDVEKNAILEHSLWPKGTALITQAFKPGWNGGTGLYLPCDRGAIPGHDGWKTQHPDCYWKSGFTIITYLECVRRCLCPLQYETTN